MKEYYNIEFTKNKLKEFMEVGKEPELCIKIKENDYMIIPF